MPRTITESPEQALARIQSGVSQNDAAVVYAFAGVGVDPADITPRVNVLTFHAWKARGRRVAKGATSQRVSIWIPVDEDDGTGKKRMRPSTAKLFHESQTIPADALKGTRPAAWGNPELVKPDTYEDTPAPQSHASA